MLPEDGDAIEGVHHAVIVREPKSDGAGVEGTCQAEAAAGDGDGGAQVELDGVVELVGVHAVDLRDVEVVVGGEPVEDLVEELHEGEAKLWWEDCLEEALAEG